MASIELRVTTTVEFVLFEKFAYSIILFKENKNKSDISRLEFFTFLVEFLGMQTTERNLENKFSAAKNIYSLEDWQYASFCKTFEDAYNGLKPRERDTYKDLKNSFNEWKSSIDKRHDITLRTELATGNPVLKLNTSATPRFADDFEDSTWYVYSIHETWKKPIIGRMIIRFSKADQNKVDVTLHHYDKNYKVRTGKAFYTEDHSIAVTVAQDSFGKSYTHYLIAVWPQVTGHDLFIGHMTRKNIKLSRNVSKVVLFERCDDENPLATTFDVESSELPEGYSEFFQADEYQPLFGPPLFICDHESFMHWLKIKNDYPTNNNRKR